MVLIKSKDAFWNTEDITVLEKRVHHGISGYATIPDDYYESEVRFIKFIQAVACGLLGILIIGLLLVRENTSSQVVYTLVII